MNTWTSSISFTITICSKSYFRQNFERVNYKLNYTLSQDILNSNFAKLLDIYRYLRVIKMFIQRYENFPRFLRLGYQISIHSLKMWFLREFWIAAYPEDNVNKNARDIEIFRVTSEYRKGVNSKRYNSP